VGGATSIITTSKAPTALETAAAAFTTSEATRAAVEAAIVTSEAPVAAAESLATEAFVAEPVAIAEATEPFTTEAVIIMETTEATIVIVKTAEVIVAEAFPAEAAEPFMEAEATVEIIRAIEPRMRVIKVVPGTGTDKHAVHEPVRGVVTVRGASKRITWIKTIGANRRSVVNAVARANLHADRNLRL